MSGFRPAGAEPETQQLRRLRTAIGAAELALGRRMAMRASDLGAMGHLAFAEEPITPSRLSVHLGMSPPAVTELVDRLERAGQVRRERDATDRRRVNLVATESALAEVHLHFDPLLTAVDRLVSQRSAADRAVITRFLAELTETYADYSTRSPADGAAVTDEAQ